MKDILSFICSWIKKVADIMGFSFMHAADLHLGSTITGVLALPMALQRRLVDASLRAFTNLLDQAIARDVDFLILSGDIFEESRPSLRVQKFFVDGITRLSHAGIQVFMATGNHDYDVFSQMVYDLPNTAKWFSLGQVDEHVVTIGEIAIKILGISYPQRTVVEDLSRLFPSASGDAISIGVLHCQLGSIESPYSSVSLPKLQALNYDYWALGHVHSAGTWNDPGLIVYPGILQGRHNGEVGEKGCYYVRFQDGVMKPTFLALQDIRWERCHLDLTMVGIGEIYDILFDCREQYRDQGDVGVLLEIGLNGSTKSHQWLQQASEVEELLSELQEGEEGVDNFLWITRLIDTTLPALDWDELMARPDFLGEFLRFLEHAACDEQIKGELESVWAVVTQNKGISIDYQEVLLKARMIGIQLLGGD